MPAVSNPALLTSLSTLEPELSIGLSSSVLPDVDAFPSLLDIVNRALDNPAPDSILTHTLESIANHEGAFGRTYRPDLFRALYHFQHASGAQLNPKADNQRLIEHLQIVEDLIAPYGINEMHVAERIGWVKLLNQHLCYLSFVQDWGELQTTHLMCATSILGKVLFDATRELELPDEREKELVNSTARIINDRLPLLLDDIENKGNRRCVMHLLGLAADFKSPELREILEDVFWQINARCAQYEPESFGTGMADDSADLDDDEFEDDEDSSIAVADEDDPELQAGGYEILEEEDLSFDERREESEGEIMEDLETVHNRLLAALIDTPDGDPFTSFWNDVLTRNSFGLTGWKIALHGLEKTDASIIEDFIAELVEEGVNNSLAVAHLLDIMSFNDQAECLAPLDKLVIAAVKQHSRKDQRKIIEHARSVINDVCELLENQDDAPAMLARLEAGLARP